LLSRVKTTLQSLRLSEKERDDSKVLMTLGNAFQKEFDKLRYPGGRYSVLWRRRFRKGSDQVCRQLVDINLAVKDSMAERETRRTRTCGWRTRG